MQKISDHVCFAIWGHKHWNSIDYWLSAGIYPCSPASVNSHPPLSSSFLLIWSPNKRWYLGWLVTVSLAVAQRYPSPTLPTTEWQVDLLQISKQTHILWHAVSQARKTVCLAHVQGRGKLSTVLDGLNLDRIFVMGCYNM